MAVKTCSMTELLSKITLTKKKMDYYTRSRDYSSVGDAMFLGLKKRGEQMVNGKHPDVIVDNIRANYQAYTDQLRNYSKLIIIKNAVNSSIRIAIAGQVMTINEALAYNSNDVKKNCEVLIAKMKSDYSSAQTAINMYNDKKFSDENINAYISTALGGVSSDELNRVKKSSPERIEELVESYRNINAMDMIDPLDIVNKINTWETWMDEFFSTVNFRLSEINSRIMIEYDLDKDSDFFRIVNMDEINRLQASSVEDQ